MRSKKTERFSRLHFGAGGKASRARPSASHGPGRPSHTGSSTRLLAVLKLWLLSLLPVVQLAPRPAPDSKEHEQARLDNLRADTALKRLQARDLEDQRQLRRLQRRKLTIDVENGEIKRALTLVAVVVIGALLVARAALAIAAPSLEQQIPNLLELCELLLPG